MAQDLCGDPLRGLGQHGRCQQLSTLSVRGILSLVVADAVIAMVTARAMRM